MDNLGAINAVSHCVLECGGKRSATPLWMAAERRSIKSAAAAVFCRRAPGKPSCGVN
ncbi:MAG TPA: hypothetical protein VG146_21060 [Verrucomicrobiae bacterium]|nr:hypothetical protein [Verrucomicrobiae bacterium]